MRAYVITSGILFALVVAAHIARMLAESAALARDPSYLLLTLAAAAMSIWAFSTLRRPRVAP
jgi:hypothetical protein